MVAPVCAAHFVSHYYMIMLAPLFAFVRADYGVSYTDLGAGADRVQRRLGAAADAGRLSGRPDRRARRADRGRCPRRRRLRGRRARPFVLRYSSPCMRVAGLGNTAYHPADYSLLSHHAPPARLGQIFSFHTFAGILGAAVAPATLLAMQSRFGWRGAYIGAAILGFAVLAFLIAQRPEPRPIGRKARPARRAMRGMTRDARPRLAASALAADHAQSLFLRSAFAHGRACNNFLIVALGALYGTSAALANVALTGLLLLNALGVLAGGVLAVAQRRVTPPSPRSAWPLAGVATALVGLIDFSSVCARADDVAVRPVRRHRRPSRDMLVRAATPPGAYGRVFGFVSTGFNIGCDDRADDLWHASWITASRARCFSSRRRAAFSASAPCCWDRSGGRGTKTRTGAVPSPASSSIRASANGWNA